MRRTRPPIGAWTYAAGGVEEGETAYDAAAREVREETGLDAASLYSADMFEQFYEISRDSICIAPVFVLFVSSSSRVVTNAEHDAHRWCTTEEGAALLTFPIAAEILDSVHHQFVLREPSPPCGYLSAETNSLGALLPGMQQPWHRTQS